MLVASHTLSEYHTSAKIETNQHFVFFFVIFFWKVYLFLSGMHEIFSKEVGHNLLKKLLFTRQRCGTVTECVQIIAGFILCFSPQVTQQTTAGDKSAQREKNDSVKLARTLCLIFVTFALCWTP